MKTYLDELKEMAPTLKTSLGGLYRRWSEQLVSLALAPDLDNVNNIKACIAGLNKQTWDKHLYNMVDNVIDESRSNMLYLITKLNMPGLYDIVKSINHLTRLNVTAHEKKVGALMEIAFDKAKKTNAEILYKTIADGIEKLRLDYIKEVEECIVTPIMELEDKIMNCNICDWSNAYSGNSKVCGYFLQVGETVFIHNGKINQDCPINEEK